MRAETSALDNYLSGSAHGITSYENAYIIVDECTIIMTGSGNIGLRSVGGVIKGETVSVTSDIGLKVTIGGSIHFRGGGAGVVVTATGNEIEIGSTPTTASISDFAAIDDYRIDSPYLGDIVIRYLT